MVMNRRNSLPPLNEMTTVQVPRPYSVSGANGRWRHSGVVRTSGARPTGMNSRDSLAAFHARRASFVSVQCVQSRRESVLLG